MSNAARRAVAPVYLFVCLIIGGSAQGIWENMFLELLGLGIIGWAATAQLKRPVPHPAKHLMLLLIAAIAIVALQQVPLPPAIWAHGSRARISAGYQVLGISPPALPISLTPYGSLSTLLAIIPPLAIFCAIVRFDFNRPSWLAVALLAGAIAGIVLGALQIVSADPNSRWYLYPDTNVGLGVGFFANANHMADLLVICLPFVAAVAAAGKSGNGQRYSALLSMVIAITIVLVAGIALNGSLAGYALAIPTLAASALIVLPETSRRRSWLIGIAALAMMASVGGLASSSLGGTKISRDAATAVESREEMLRNTGKAIADYMPLGSGLGSFVKVYRLYETPDGVTNEYVVHAHNDYAELTLELGVPGVILLLLFLTWWAKQCLAVWRKGKGGPFARAASIASAAILVHSLVDFPLRTAAISACFAACLALLADRRAPVGKETSDLRPTRHLVIG